MAVSHAEVDCEAAVGSSSEFESTLTTSAQNRPGLFRSTDYIARSTFYLHSTSTTLPSNVTPSHESPLEWGERTKVLDATGMIQLLIQKGIITP